jgi:hypothetical protein
MTLLHALALFLCAQDQIQQDITLRVDPLGDAALQVEFQLSAKQWINWKSSYGDHPSIMKRDIVDRLCTQEIYDFEEPKKAEMDRKATISLKGRGAARYKGDGKFEVLLPANLKEMMHNETEWVFVHTEPAAHGVLLQQKQKIVLPSGAREIHLAAPVDGQQKLTYELPPPKGLNLANVLFFSGILGLGLSTLLAFASKPPPERYGSTVKVKG